MVLLNTLLLMVLLAMVLLLFAAGILYIMSFYSCSSGGGGGGAKLNLTEATANLIQSISVGGDNSAHISPPFPLFYLLI